MLSRSLSSHVHLFVWLSLNGCGLSLWASSLLVPHCATWYDAWFMQRDLLDFTGNAVTWRDAHLPHRAKDLTWARCVCTLCFVLRHISSYIIHARRWVQRESSVVLRWTAFIRTYMYSWFSWLYSHLPLSVMCVINRVNPLSWLRLQAAGMWASACDCGSELAWKLNDQADTQPSCDKDK